MEELTLSGYLKSKGLIFKTVVDSMNEFTMSIAVKAKPGAKVEKVDIGPNGELILAVRKKPVDGEANEALIEKISEVFGVAKSQIELVSGHKSKLKHFYIKFQLNKAKKEADYIVRCKI